jgi:hypothetical protein
MLRVDPLWSLALFGLLVGAGTSSIFERILGFRIFRFIGAASYGTALVVVPVASFVVRQVVLSLGPAGTAANAGIVAFLAGIVIWQLADRWFADGTVRRDVAEIVGPWLNKVLHIVRADRVTLGAPPAVIVPVEDPVQSVDTGFYAPPPRSNGDLASVSMRTGSAEDLAAEILETKKRLSDRSSEIFAENEAPPAPEPEPEPVETVLQPGFYRRPPAEKTAATAQPAAAQAAPAPKPPLVTISPPPQAAQSPAARPLPPPAPRETAGISLSFQAPEYDHYSLEPAAPAAPVTPAPVPVAQVPIAPVPAAYVPVAPPPVAPVPVASAPVAPPAAPVPAAPVEPPAASSPLPPSLRPTAPPLPPAPPAGGANTRGPIRMRIGALGPAPSNGNGSSSGVFRKADN